MSISVTPGPVIAYLEDAPADTGTMARGLSKAIVPLLKCIDDQIATYFVYQRHMKLSSRQMPRFVRAKLIEGYSHGRISRQAWRLATVLPPRLGLAIACRLRPHASTIVPAREGAFVWAPIGIDPGTLVRAWCIARQIDVPLHVYLVDDIESHPSNTRNGRLNRLVACILRDAARVYTITDELGALCKRRYHIRVRRLPLIPDTHQIKSIKPPSEAQHRRPFAVFLGSINHLYEDGLRRLISSVDKLRKDTGKELELRFFSDAMAVRQLCGGEIPPWIIAGPEKDDAVVRQQIETATLCFLPYSFDETASSMVTTSFPSKLLDYLTDAQAIVVYAPDYSIAHKTLSREYLPYVASTPEALSEVLRILATQGPTFHSKYRALLSQKFSCNCVKQALAEPW